MWRGERAALGIVREKMEPEARYVWFHAASLGEFEQGRPLMEQMRSEYPEYKILLTFFLLRAMRCARITRGLTSSATCLWIHLSTHDVFCELSAL